MTARFGRVAALVTGLLVLPVAAAHAGTPPGDERPAAVSIHANAAPKGTAPEVATPTYAERETASKSLEQFAGGGAGIYIGGSTAAIVLLVVLLIVIL